MGVAEVREDSKVSLDSLLRISLTDKTLGLSNRSIPNLISDLDDFFETLLLLLL